MVGHNFTKQEIRKQRSQVQNQELLDRWVKDYHPEKQEQFQAQLGSLWEEFEILTLLVSK